MPCTIAQRLFEEWSKVLDERMFYHPNNKANHGETHSRAKELRRALQIKSEELMQGAVRHKAACTVCQSDKRQELDDGESSDYTPEF
jgi:hypothetical protein